MKRNQITVLLLIAAIQGILFIFPAPFLNTYFHVVKPLLFILLGFFCLIFIGRDERTYEIKADYLQISLFGVLIYVSILFICGYLQGFNYNPMDLSVKGILINSWAFLTVIIIRELIRSRMTAAASGQMMAAVTLVFTFSSMDNLRSLTLSRPGLILDYALTVFLPLLVLNIFLTWTAYQGGLAGNLMFAAAYQAVPILSPYLPDIPKILDAIMLYTILFILYLMIVNIRWKNRRTATPFQKPPDWKWMTLTGGILAACFLFGFGVFRHIPVAVASNSMKGVFSKGDLVIIEKVDRADNIEVGDILQYRAGEISVIHRVSEITYTEAGGKQFITKGDQNPAIDLYPVRSSQVVGRYIYRIPYIGYPALLFTFFNEVQSP